MNPLEISIKDYNYILPDEKIAKYPLKNRDCSKLLIFKDGAISQTVFNTVTNYLDDSKLLVFNNTKVIQARMIFQKQTGANIEIFCLEPYNPADYNLAFQQNKECYWKCIVGNLKRWKNELLSNEITVNNQKYTLVAERIKDENTSIIIKFKWDAPISFGEILEIVGKIPIPPYLNRKAEDSDTERYQTVYSKHKGSVAAPTAGLHFTPEVFDNLKAKNIETVELTLHVGAGTFKPVQSETIEGHEMHTEYFSINLNTLKKIANKANNICAVGTTSVRTLESLYWLGVQIIKSNEKPTNFLVTQWEAYQKENNISTNEAFGALINHLETTNQTSLQAATQIMIVPSYQFRVINSIITNFHQPQSTLLLLIAAFIGEDWIKMYNYALANNFRFLSYGDSSLLIR